MNNRKVESTPIYPAPIHIFRSVSVGQRAPYRTGENEPQRLTSGPTWL
jgi:hypothetical protein